MPKYKLTINTIPKDCRIVLYSKRYNDIEYNKSALLLDGHYKIKILRYGYVPQIHEVDLNTNKELSFTLERKKIPVKIVTHPENCTIKIKEKNTNEVFKEYEEREFELPIGSYDIEVSKHLHFTQTDNFTIYEDDDIVNLYYNLYRTNLQVRFHIKPDRSHLYLDGKDYKNNRKDFIMQPGNYSYTITNPDKPNSSLSNTFTVLYDDVDIYEVLDDRKYKVIYNTNEFDESDIRIISASKTKYSPDASLYPGDYIAYIKKPGYKLFKEVFSIKDKDYNLRARLSNLARDGEYNLTFNIDPEDAIVELYENKTRNRIYGTNNIFKVRENTVYDYRISRYPLYQTLIDKVNIKKKNVIVNRLLLKDKNVVNFQVNPQYADVVVYDNKMNAYRGNFLELPNGQYKFEVTMDGYKPAKGTFTLHNQDLNIPIKLRQIEKSKVAFVLEGYNFDDSKWVSVEDASIFISGNGYERGGYEHYLTPGQYKYEIKSTYGAESGVLNVGPKDSVVRIKINEFLLSTDITIIVNYYPEFADLQVSAKGYNRDKKYKGRNIEFKFKYGTKGKFSVTYYKTGGYSTDKKFIADRNKKITIKMDEKWNYNLDFTIEPYFANVFVDNVAVHEQGTYKKNFNEWYNNNYIEVFREPGPHILYVDHDGFRYEKREVKAPTMYADKHSSFVKLNIDGRWKIEEYDNSKLKRYLPTKSIARSQSRQFGGILDNIYLLINVFDINTLENITDYHTIGFWLYGDHIKAVNSLFDGHGKRKNFRPMPLRSMLEKGGENAQYEIRTHNANKPGRAGHQFHHNMYLQDDIVKPLYGYGLWGLDIFLYKEYRYGDIDYERVQVKVYKADYKGINTEYKGYRRSY